MKVLQAKTSGFCFGVERAIQMALDAAKTGKVTSLGKLIHNKAVLTFLQEQGIDYVNNLQDVPTENTVIIRAHGASPDIYETDKSLLDATCPKVKKVHEIITNQCQLGRQVVIYGDYNHPETIAHIGWCNGNAIVVNNLKDVDKIPSDSAISVVAQTTMSQKVWEELKIEISNRCADTIFFNTICAATSQRQTESVEIAKQSDVMVVIGDTDSSNSKKLLEVCQEHCKNTYFIENVSQLPMDKLKNAKTIGLTAGASTPEWIIKEVANIMLDERNQDENIQTEELSFAEQLEQSMVSLYTGEVAKGTVIDVTPTEIVVDLGFKSDGVIPADEISSNPTIKPSDVAKVGDEISAFVIRVNDIDGHVKLSLRKLEQIENAKKIEAAVHDNTIIHGKVTRVIDGGLIVISGDTRIFVPASHASSSFVQDLSIMLGKEVDLRIIEVQPRRRKIVGSIKMASNAASNAQQAEFWENIFIGKKFTGTVKTLASFGAFVDLGGVDGLVHISELSWGKIKHPEDVLAVGDSIDVYVKGIDLEKRKVSLGYKNPDENPWLNVTKNLHVGDVVKCKIARIVPFGAFAEIFPSVDGLIHISQLDIKHVANVSSVVHIGQEVEAKVTAIDIDNEKISLSLAALMDGFSEADVEETAAETIEGTEVETAPVLDPAVEPAIESIEEKPVAEAQPEQEIESAAESAPKLSEESESHTEE